jgi:hypothetical protein
VHVLGNDVPLIDVLVTYIEHLGERQELGILMLASNLAHFAKIPLVLYVTADMESECSRVAVVEIPVNLLEVSLWILMVDCRVDGSRLDDLLIDEVVSEVS